jgi:hypothetical protein
MTEMSWLGANMKWDLSQLYSQLDLQPDCTLQEFKSAYQRRIAELHPDRGADASTPEVRLLLPELIWLYTAATRFHRRHGRLPGTAAPPRDPGAGSQMMATALSPAVASCANSWSAASRSRPPGDADKTPSPRTTAWALLLLVLLLVLTFSWGWLSPPTPEESSSAPVRSDPKGAAITDAHDLELGMDEATVIAIQGDPMLVRNKRWDFGPSWVEFDEGRVVDWYSSPQHPLRTATPSPASKPSGSAE